MDQGGDGTADPLIDRKRLPHMAVVSVTLQTPINSECEKSVRLMRRDSCSSSGVSLPTERNQNRQQAPESFSEPATFKSPLSCTYNSSSRGKGSQSPQQTPRLLDDGLL